jgi:uncharacterized protein YaaQ
VLTEAGQSATYLALALVGGGVCRHEAHFVVGLDNALLHAARQHIADTCTAASCMMDLRLIPK